MRISVAWLGEWVDVGDDIGALAHELTMAGLEVEGVEPASPALPGIVVGEVLTTRPHPDADKLTVCAVRGGSREPLQIVCGAPNVRPGLKAPLAVVGARLPGGLEIARAMLRGVESQGMLCSAKELGLSEDASGLLELPADLDTGADLTAVLALDDSILSINLTPNRGDCMSVRGIAREVGAIRDRALAPPSIEPCPPSLDDQFPVRLEAGADCPTFVARVIRGVDSTKSSPLWIRERLRRAGLRPVNAIVDVTNYVMLELGQPMHAYDLAQLQAAVVVRRARAGEALTLLDGRTITLDGDVLVIADESQLLGLAGIMGGERTGIAATTTDVFLEVAFFDPGIIAGRARRFGLVTDASQRFERGVDPALQVAAAERATQLLLECAGGAAGPCVEHRIESAQRWVPQIKVRPDRVARVLGVELAPGQVVATLEKLGCVVEYDDANLQVKPPSWRFDLAIEEDFVEEVGRLIGFDNIPETPASMSQRVRALTEQRVDPDRAALLLVDRGYQEAVTYSFTSPELQAVLHPDEQALTLSNPISVDLSTMRLSLWPGLLSALALNQRRRCDRVHLFEIGRRYSAEGIETDVIAGVAAGSVAQEQWGEKTRAVDFYDVKADLEALLQLTGRAHRFRFASASHAALHPQQCARILLDDQPVGWLGTLHPEIVSRFDLTYGGVLFDLELAAALEAQVPEYREISRYPAIRRDIAAIVEESTESEAIERVVREAAGALLQTLLVFDVYSGPGVEKGKKSIALGLNLQDTSRTLMDVDAEAVVARVVEHLNRTLGATIRDR